MAKPKPSKAKRAPEAAGQVLDRRGRSIPLFESSRIRSEVGNLWRKVHKRGAVAITADGAPLAVMLSAEGFLELLFSPGTKSLKKARGRRR